MEPAASSPFYISSNVAIMNTTEDKATAIY
jgi:hypothetical protein